MQATSFDSARKDVNRMVKQYLKTHGGLVIRHPSIIHTEKRLFRYDGTHLNQLGNSVLLNGLQRGLETLLLSKSGMSVFPDDRQVVQS